MSVETLDDLEGIELEDDATAACRAAMGPIAPSCRKAKESYLGFDVEEGRGGGMGTD